MDNTNTVEVPGSNDNRILRNVLLGNTGYRLITWEVRGPSPKSDHSVIGYAFYPPSADGQTKPLFIGEDFCSPSYTSIDSDVVLRNLMGFLTLRPGDTDREYFDDYTKEQMEFAEGHDIDELSAWACDGFDYEGDSAEFVDSEVFS